MKIKDISELGTLISLCGEVGNDMLKQFDAGAQKVLEKEGEQRATILLTTGGGKVAFGEALTERIRFLSGFVDLRIVAATFVMSAGVRIFLALPKERRFITPNGIIMIHPQTRNDDATSTVSNEERERILNENLLNLKFAKQREEKWIRDLSRELGLPYRETKELWRRSHYFSAKEAVERGLAQAIISF